MSAVRTMRGPRCEVRRRHGAWQVRCRACQWHDYLPVSGAFVRVFGASASQAAWLGVLSMAHAHAAACRGPHQWGGPHV